MSDDSNHAWQRVNTAGITLPQQPRQRLKLYADEQVPQPIIAELRTGGIAVLAAADETGRRGHPDENVQQRARQLHRVLLTFDHDFWSDRAFPLQTTRGIIVVGVPRDDLYWAAAAIIRFYVRFAQYWPRAWWTQTKALVHGTQFTLKFRTWEGHVDEAQYRWRAGSLEQRPLR